MRLGRVLFILTAFYIVLIGGTAYFTLLPPVRYFHHAFMTLLLIGWLLFRLRRGTGLPATPLNAPLFAGVIVWFGSAAFSLDPRMALENLWFPLVHTLLFFVLVDQFQRGQMRLVLDTQFILAAIVVFITGIELASWYFGTGWLPGTEVGWSQVGGLPLTVRRVALALNISTLLAGYVAPLVTLTLAWGITQRRRDARLPLLLLAVLLLLVLVLTGSRGGLLSLAVAVGLFGAFRLAAWRTFARRIPLRLFAAVTVAGLLTVLVGFVVYTASQDRRSGDEGRLDMWLSAALMVRDDPLTGVGPGLFGRAYREYRDTSIARDKLASAHNAYLNTAAETGVIGLVVSGWLLFAFGRGWWRTWRQAETPAERLRREAVLAALIGIGVHSLVDTFTITPVVLLLLGLAAYSVTDSRTGSTPTGGTPTSRPPRLALIPAGVALLLLVAYGAWFVLRVDPAYDRYLVSLSGNLPLDERFQAAADAAALDPALRLYPLQSAYLRGLDTDTPEELAAAVTAYQTALDLEPTWDTGWLNLAALNLRQDNPQAALAAITEALRINPLTAAPLNRAQLAEAYDLLPRTPIITAYGLAITNGIDGLNGSFLPLAPYWTATPTRQAALNQVLPTLDPDLQYRILAVHDPARAAALVPTDPQTAGEWWIVGEAARTVSGDPAAARSAFDRAIAMQPLNGDYYVSRAKTWLTTDPAAAQRDLTLALLVGTRFESANALRAQLADTPEEAQSLRLRAVPVSGSGQEFAAVLYGGRASAFDLLPEMRPPGPGTAVMQPWYDAAEVYADSGQFDNAIRLYRLILRHAPDEITAQQQLDALIAAQSAS